MARAIRLIIILVLCTPGFLQCQNLDIRLLRHIYNSSGLPSDKFCLFISNSDIFVVLGTPAAMAAAGLIKRNDSLLRNSLVTISATCINVAITNALKYSIDRVRPYAAYPDILRKDDPSGPSFPSGHTSNAFATATSISLAYPEWYIVIPAYVYAGSVAYSRMHLGVHYPSDVLAGALIGAGSAYITFRVNKMLLGRKKS